MGTCWWITCGGWSSKACRRGDRLAMRDLSRYMAGVGAEYAGPYGRPWRAGKEPYSQSSLDSAAACLKRFYQFRERREPTRSWQASWTASGCRPRPTGGGCSSGTWPGSSRPTRCARHRRCGAGHSLPMILAPILKVEIKDFFVVLSNEGDGIPAAGGEVAAVKADADVG